MQMVPRLSGECRAGPRCCRILETDAESGESQKSAPWSPGQSGNPKGRPRAPRFTEREPHEMRAALAGILGGRTQREAVKAMGAVLTNPPHSASSAEVLRPGDWRTCRQSRSASEDKNDGSAPGDDHVEHELRPEKGAGGEVGVRCRQSRWAFKRQWAALMNPRTVLTSGLPGSRRNGARRSHFSRGGP